MDDRERKALALEWAGRLLEAELNHWEPDGLIAQIGAEEVELLAVEIGAVARRLRSRSRRSHPSA